MRRPLRGVLALAAFVVGAANVHAQDSAASGAAANAAANAAAVAQQAPGTSTEQERPATGKHTDKVRSAIRSAGRDPLALPLPPADSFTVGNRRVDAGSTTGTVAVAFGTLEVFGTVTGNAIAVNGDVVLHPGARVDGNVFAARGRAITDSGTVGGEIRELGGDVGPAPKIVLSKQTATGSPTRHALGLAFGWLVMLVLIGIGVLVFAGSYLDGVVETLEASFWRSLWVGVAAELAVIPALLLLIVGLALTILGILLIPFAVVAYFLGVAGLVTLGFLGVARLTGQSLASSAARRLAARGAALRAITVGVLVLMSFWIVSALFTWLPIVGLILRAVALAVTWVAASAGLGAAVLSRAGSRRLEMAPRVTPEPDPLAWQTPTPVAGVVAARRPTAMSGRDER